MCEAERGQILEPHVVGPHVRQRRHAVHPLRRPDRVRRPPTSGRQHDRLAKQPGPQRTSLSDGLVGAEDRGIDPVPADEMIETPSPDGTLAHIAFEVADVELSQATAVDAGCLGDIGLIRIAAAGALATQVRSKAGTAFQFIRYEAGSPDLTDRRLDAPAYRDTEGTAR